MESFARSGIVKRNIDGNTQLRQDSKAKLSKNIAEDMGERYGHKKYCAPKLSKTQKREREKK